MHSLHSLHDPSSSSHLSGVARLPIVVSAFAGTVVVCFLITYGLRRGWCLNSDERLICKSRAAVYSACVELYLYRTALLHLHGNLQQYNFHSYQQLLSIPYLNRFLSNKHRYIDTEVICYQLVVEEV